MGGSETRRERKIKLIEHVENVTVKLNITEEEACEILKEPYEKYLEAKKKHMQS